MNQKAQTTMELMILLIISMVALVLIYAMYAEQVSAGNFQREQFAANNSLLKIKNSANLLVLSGAGSKTTVDVEFLGATRLDETTIFGNTILLTLSNGTELFVSADANFSGNLRDLRGKHKIKLYYDGNTVLIYYGDFEINQQSISISLIAGVEQNEEIIIKNSHANSLVFYVENNFSHDQVSLVLDEESFSLSPAELKSVNLNFTASQIANGNYVGNIKIIATIDDRNVEQIINISLEVLQEFTPILISPYSNEFITYQGAQVTKNISICNKTLLEIDEVNWSKNGSVDANISQWFDLPSDEIIIPKNECVVVPIIFNVPLDADLKEYDGNLTAQIGSELVTTYFVAEVILVNKIFLQSTTNNTLPINFSKSFFIKQNNLSYLIPTGEIDYNNEKDFSVNGEGWDTNLVAYYKFNDTNGTHVFDSARGNDGLLVNDANINAEGLWDSNAASFDGVDDYIEVEHSEIFLFDDFSISFWINRRDWVFEWARIIDKDWVDGFSVNRFSDTNNITFHVLESDPQSIGEIPANKWTHIVVVRKNEFRLIYINGNLDINIGGFNSSQLTSTANLAFGQNRSTSEGDELFDGLIDEVKIYNKALTQEEIVADYNSFLSAKFVDANIVDAGRVVDWNSFFINKDVVFESERELMQLDFNIFTCSDLLCNNKTSSQIFLDVNNSIIKNLTALSNSQYLGFEVFFNKRNGVSSNLAGDFFKNPFLKDINIIVN